MLIKVDLPDPFGPMRPRISPARTSSVTPASACRPRKAFVTPVHPSSGTTAARAGDSVVTDTAALAGASTDAIFTRHARLRPPATPSGRNTMTTIKIAPMSARFRIALSPPVSDCVSAVTMTAPIESGSRR